MYNFNSVDDGKFIGVKGFEISPKLLHPLFVKELLVKN